MYEFQKAVKKTLKEWRIKQNLFTALTVASMWGMIWGLYYTGQYNGASQVLRDFSETIENAFCERS